MFRFVLLFLLPVLQATPPGLLVQVNQRGLNEAISVGVMELNSNIPGTHIPDTGGKEAKSLFEWQLTNIIINKFSADLGHSSAALHPPDTVALAMSNLHIEVDAHYHIKVGSGWLSISKSGSVSVDTSNGRVSASVDLKTSSDGHPALQDHSCDNDLGDLNIHFHGDVIDDIIDLFKKYIADYVKDKLKGVICDQLKSLISDDANKFLSTIPITVEIDTNIEGQQIDGLYLNYGLTADPFATTSYVALPMQAKFWYKGHENDAGIPAPDGQMGPAAGNKMLCLNFDADSMFNSAAYAFQVSPYSHTTLDQHAFSMFGDSVAKMMQCHCDSGLCVGSMVPAIQTVCPVGGVVDVAAATTGPIVFKFNSTGAFALVAATGAFIAHLPNDTKTSLFNVTVSVGLEVPSTFRFEDWKIYGDVNITGATLKVVYSAIGDISDASLNMIWDMVLNLVIQGTLDQLLKNGIQLPQVPHVDFVDPVISFKDKKLLICTDIKYSA